MEAAPSSVQGQEIPRLAMPPRVTWRPRCKGTLQFSVSRSAPRIAEHGRGTSLCHLSRQSPRLTAERAAEARRAGGTGLSGAAVGSNQARPWLTG